jgi:cytochrome c peroxidase
MKKLFLLTGIVTVVAVAYSCKKTNNETTASYLDLPSTPYVYNNASGDPSFNSKASLGRVLFYDSHLSLNNAISCGSCHKQALGFADNAALSAGYEGRVTKRNSKSLSNLEGDDVSLFNVAQPGATLFWDGREDILQNLIARPLTNHVEMGIEDPNTLPGKLAGVSYYGALFSQAYNGDSSLTFTRITECLSDFLISLQSHNTRFDKYLTTGNTSGFSAVEIEGMNLFVTKYNCASCHHIFSNTYSIEDAFKDIGVDATYTDLGRGAISSNPADNGKFHVPNLRNVVLSAPYMHDGRFATLDEVIDHYSQGIQNSPNLDTMLQNPSGGARQMNISAQEKTAIIAFLGTLTDYNMITDPKFSNPFKTK